MKHLDLFAGIGGFALAARWMGWETVAFVEREPFCQKVLRKNFREDIETHDDITTFTTDNLVNACYNKLNANQRKELHMAAHRKDYDEAVRMYDNGLSIGDIAKFYNITRQAMWVILKRRGCKFRSQQRYETENHFYRGTKADERAHDVVEKAIKRGILVPSSTCEVCGTGDYRYKDGRTGIQAHHCNYNKPLEVMWLCQKCHHKWHKENQAIPLKEAQGAEEVNRLFSIDIVTGGFP